MDCGPQRAAPVAQQPPLRSVLFCPSHARRPVLLFGGRVASIESPPSPCRPSVTAVMRPVPSMTSAGMTPVEVAIKTDNIEAVEMLLDDETVPLNGMRCACGGTKWTRVPRLHVRWWGMRRVCVRGSAFQRPCLPPCLACLRFSRSIKWINVTLGFA